MKNEIDESTIDFYRCGVCGNLIVKLNDSGICPQCCGRDMVKLTPNEKDDADLEKHVPVWMMDGCKIVIQVGSEDHPMTPEHYIQWIVVKTNLGIHAKHLTPDDAPSACFKFCKGEEPLTIYEYCNIHGLWMSSKEDADHECPLCRFGN